MESAGVPIDLETFKQIQDHWDDIKLSVVGELDAGRGIYEGASFRTQRFADYLHRARDCMAAA